MRLLPPIRSSRAASSAAEMRPSRDVAQRVSTSVLDFARTSARHERGWDSLFAIITFVLILLISARASAAKAATDSAAAKSVPIMPIMVDDHSQPPYGALQSEALKLASILRKNTPQTGKPWDHSTKYDLAIAVFRNAKNCTAPAGECLLKARAFVDSEWDEYSKKREYIIIQGIASSLQVIMSQQEIVEASKFASSQAGATFTRAVIGWGTDRLVNDFTVTNLRKTNLEIRDRFDQSMKNSISTHRQ